MMVSRYVCTLVVMSISVQGSLLQVNTTTGPIRGKTETIFNYTIKQWLGIPYAQAPVRYRRFRNPLPVNTWTEVKQTIRNPPACYQPIKESKIDKMRFLRMPTEKMSEDCLYLNVYTPVDNTGRKKYSTIVWLHGGQFMTGSVSHRIYDPKVLVARENVIVVTVQYRLGLFGFMYFGTEDVPGNMGLMDQALALQWAYQNIDKFGGSNADITLMGQSAGAVSVGVHMMWKETQDLFQKVILESGSPLCSWASAEPGDMLQRSKAVAAHIGCSLASNNDDLRACLMGKRPDELMKGLKAILPLSPMVDGDLVKVSPQSSQAIGDIKVKAALVSLVKNEGIAQVSILMNKFKRIDFDDMTDDDFHTILKTLASLFRHNITDLKEAALDYKRNMALSKNMNTRVVSQLLGDTGISCSTIEFAHAIANQNIPTYFMYFNHRSKISQDPSFVEVMHGDEIKYHFGIPFTLRENFTNEDRQVSANLMKYVANFAKTGFPDNDWVSYSDNGGVRMVPEAGERREPFCSILTKHSINVTSVVTSSMSEVVLKEMHRISLGDLVGRSVWKLRKHFLYDVTVNNNQSNVYDVISHWKSKAKGLSRLPRFVKVNQ